MLSNSNLKQRPFSQYIITEDFNLKSTPYKSDGSGLKTNLICIGEVQKSGAKVYFCPANNDFCTIHRYGDKETYVEHYQSANEAYRSQDW